MFHYLFIKYQTFPLVVELTILESSGTVVVERCFSSICRCVLHPWRGNNGRNEKILPYVVEAAKYVTQRSARAHTRFNKIRAYVVIINGPVKY